MLFENKRKTIMKNQKYYEILSQNSQKGEVYLVKLKENPVIFEGIPLINELAVSSPDNSFIIKIHKPEKYKGFFKASIDDIEQLEKKH